MKISFIGYGNMAQAIAKSLLNNERFQLFASAPRLTIATNPDGVSTHCDNKAIVPKSDIVIIAVKPAQVASVLTEICPLLPKNSLVISIAAGVSLENMAQYCTNQQAIVRCMPNLPIALRLGASALIGNQYVSESQHALVEQVFQQGGIISWLDNEADLDTLTALSGSGPAYIFLFLEAMITAAQRLGLSAQLAQSFALQTMTGAVAFAQQSNCSLSALRQQVTSPNGTTAAAIKQFEVQHFDQLVFNAMQAAHQRAQELNSINNNH